MIDCVCGCGSVRVIGVCVVAVDAGVVVGGGVGGCCGGRDGGEAGVCVCELGKVGGGCMRVSLGRNATLPSVCAPDNNVKSCVLAKRGLVAYLTAIRFPSSLYSEFIASNL